MNPTFKKPYSLQIRGLFLAIFLGLLSFQLAQAGQGPRHVYLTWQGNTSTTLTVVFQSAKPISQPMVYYGESSASGVRGYKMSRQAKGSKFPGLSRWVYFAKLTNLQPGGTYHFRAGGTNIGYSRERKFRTIESNPKKLRFISGGDMWIEPATFQLMRQAASQSPHFAMVGGDIAYADGRVSHVNFWDKWFDGWDEFMVTPAGYSIPMVLAVGNHETQGGFDAKPEAAPYFYKFFRQNPKGYFSRKFGKDVVVYVLDSGHTNPHGGAQAKWLAQEMKRTAQRPHGFALYHVPCYPSYPDAHNGPYETAGRTHWVPLFDKYKLSAAFENHYHTFKRTKPLRNGKVDPKGTVYLGDGCWGRPPRKIKARKDWFDEVIASRQHVWLVDVKGDSVTYRAMDPHGRVFDSYTQSSTKAVSH